MIAPQADDIVLIIRTSNAMLWTLVIVQIIRWPLPIPKVIRELLGTVVVFGMWVFVFGAAVPLLNLSYDLIRVIYTAFTAYAGIVAIGILSSRILDEE